MNGHTNRRTACCEGSSTNAVAFKFIRSGEGNFRASPCTWLPAAMFEKDLKNAFIISRLGWHEKKFALRIYFLIKFNDVFRAQAKELKSKPELHGEREVVDA